MSFPRRTLEGLAKIIEDLKQMMQNSSIPQGTIWWFHGRTTAPDGWAICDGENGTPDLIGRYPLGAKTRIGRKVSAGLPNIVGTIASLQNGGTNTTGAFSTDNDTSSSRYDGAGAGFGFEYNFDASRCDDIYGNSSTVTPPSVRLLPCMKL